MKKNEGDEERWARLRAGRRWTAEDARWMVESWRTSGATTAAFATSRGIDGGRLTRWRRRFGEPRTSVRGMPAGAPGRTPAAALVPVSVRLNPSPSTGDDGSGLVVVSNGEVRVEIRDRQATSPEWVARFLRSLRTEVRP